MSCDSLGSYWLAEDDLRVHALGPGVLTYSYARRLLPWLRANAHHYDAVIVNGIWQYHSYAAWRALHASRYSRTSSSPTACWTRGSSGATHSSI